MSTVFADTSGLLALVNPDDQYHHRAIRRFEAYQTASTRIVTTSYVLVETYAILGRRLGAEAVQDFRTEIAPLLEVEWVDEDLHNQGLDWLVARGTRRPGIVDAVSFTTMRKLRVHEAFAFDADFAEQGFATPLPP